MDHEIISAVGQANALVLGNAAEIGARVIARIAGNEISNTLQGESATKEKLVFLLIGQISKHVQARNKNQKI